MGRNANTVNYIIVMVAAVVAMDLLFFRHRFGERLVANIALVLAFAVFYLVFLNRA